MMVPGGKSGIFISLKQEISAVMFLLLKLTSLGLSRKVLKASSRLLSWSSDLAVSRVVNTSPRSWQAAFGSAEASRELPQFPHAAKDPLSPGGDAELTSSSLPPLPSWSDHLHNAVSSTCAKGHPGPSHTALLDTVLILLKSCSPNSKENGLFGGV